MRIALITTTINIPRVLALYRAFDPDVRFFVAGDLKTPDRTQEFCDTLGNCVYLSPDAQCAFGYKHSELIGFSTDSRRNIALLEALKWKPDIIISWDDDMITTSPTLFGDFEALFDDFLFSGLKLGAPYHWLDAGQFTIPAARQRGLPVEGSFSAAPDFVADVKIGAAQGIILGVPDTDAITAIANKPVIYSATDILRHGFVVDQKARSVFNSQLTAFRRELAPCFAQFYKWQGRNTDIIASVLMRAVMRNLNLYTYFGPPFAFHARSTRPLLPDLKAEMWGLEHIEEIASFCDTLPAADVLTACRYFLGGCPGFSDELRAGGLAWCEDCEGVINAT